MSPAWEESDDFVIRAGDVKPGEPPRVYITRFGVVVNDENGVALHAHDGSVTRIHSDGTHVIENPAFRRIAIEDARTLSGFVVRQVFDTTSHTLEFVGGGRFAYLMDATGRMLEVTTHRVEAVQDNDGVLLLKGTSPGRADPGHGDA
ncbi:hypothetical protein [Pseudacidovorax sp. RU35E]|uniref:hypothetical protein n=1 Tax=Pseudacidovorax sp. RU35E TaxID=1907403 RepID=UPI00095447B1|nr:hypothetical protein [Pseudacidovorax sp. RU35E]SIR68120.1 hypothetical protein SAMN05880557_11679 [Pseudacidovorax sp. RU35E]